MESLFDLLTVQLYPGAFALLTFLSKIPFAGAALKLEVAPVCMTYEDYYAAFAPGSHPSLSVSPQAGRMDRRGGEKTVLNVVCTPNGYAGTFTGDLVINLPEDNSKICYKITAKSY